VGHERIFHGEISWSVLGMVLVLLIVEMTAPPWPFHHGNGVDLAAVQNAIPMPGALRDDAMIVHLRRDGRVFFGSHAVPAEDLADEIQRKMKRSGEKRLFMKVDARAKYGDVGAVLEEVRKVGIWRVSFLVEQMQRPMEM
jgi:biopolymer transport protein ExbD